MFSVKRLSFTSSTTWKKKMRVKPTRGIILRGFYSTSKCFLNKSDLRLIRLKDRRRDSYKTIMTGGKLIKVNVNSASSKSNYCREAEEVFAINHRFLSWTGIRVEHRSCQGYSCNDRSGFNSQKFLLDVMAKKEQRFENSPVIQFRIYKICQNLKMVNRKQKKIKYRV